MKISQAKQLVPGDIIYQWLWHFNHWHSVSFRVTDTYGPSKGPRKGRVLGLVGDRSYSQSCAIRPNTPPASDSGTGMSFQEIAEEWDTERRPEPRVPADVVKAAGIRIGPDAWVMRRVAEKRLVVVPKQTPRRGRRPVIDVTVASSRGGHATKVREGE